MSNLTSLRLASLARLFAYCFATGNRAFLAALLVCALLATQWGLNRHVVEHHSQQILTLTAVGAASALANDSAPVSHDGPGCLICLEHQAHGAALSGSLTLTLALTLSMLLARALPPNTPYLAPERARQRAPPAFS